MQAGDLLPLDVTKPAAGGRMLARHEGLVVLVHGAIPGERVRVRIERVGKGVAYAETVDVLDPSPDRRTSAADWRCGGSVLAHVDYQRQLALKGEIVADAFARIGRLPISAPPVIPSPEHGYRMRARLHARGDRLGLFREGSHELCDVAATGQLLPDTLAWLASFERRLREERLAGVIWVEVAENIPGTQRACHVEIARGESPTRYAALHELAGNEVSDVLHARPDDRGSALRLRRDVRAFFQGNRFLLERLVQHVVALVSAGPVLDLYAGVGLFGLSLCAAGLDDITLVEGDAISGSDLVRNAEPFGARVRVERRSVESYVLRRRAGVFHGTCLVDPPRTGISRDAMRGLLASEPDRIVYVSCDPPTLARDAGALTGAGYVMAGLTGFDLFPNTAHVETVVLFERALRR